MPSSSSSPTLHSVPNNARQITRTASLPPYLPAFENSADSGATPASMPSLPAMMPPSGDQQSATATLGHGAVEEGDEAPGSPSAHSIDGGDDDDDVDGEHDSEDDSENDDVHHVDPYPWTGINEDTSVPCADELTFIESKKEHSALDHAYWEDKTFFDLNDPAFVPGAAGRIDWLVKSFNGTQQRPNNQLVMRSSCIEIGGYLWQIKLYPKGNNTDFLSVYVECVSMQTPGFQHQKVFEHLPMPRAEGAPPIMKRVSVAAQLSVVMYNPAEPRVHEHQTDAHQFHEHSTDFGWRYFTRESRQHFHRRKHGQRQAILKDDVLAFSAYIRIVDDPTGCLWHNALSSPDVSISTTGLRPLDGSSAQIAAIVMLIHLRPFRIWLETTKQRSPVVSILQVMLGKALHRRLKKKHLKYFGLPEGCDVIAVLHGIRTMLHKHDSNLTTNVALEQLLEGMTNDKQRIAHQRLSTRRASSIQEAVRKLEPSSKPPILLLELERQTFDSNKRSWEKINNPVHIENFITFGGTHYILYGVVMHHGALGSGHYTPYVRPGGPSKFWYMYDAHQVKCLTPQAAQDILDGTDRPTVKTKINHYFPHQTRNSSKKQDRGVVYLAWYLRKDYSYSAFSSEQEERCPPADPAKTDAAQSSTENVRQPQTETRWSVKDNTMLDPSPMSAIRSTLHNNSHISQDSADVIMSDTEEDYAQQVMLARALHDTSNSTSTPPVRQSIEQTSKKVFSFFSGEYYNGEVLPDDTYHGQGWLIRTNGDEYHGSFRNGVPNGEGTMVYSKSGDRYTGQWLDGQHHGQGKMTEKQTGNVYEGGWKEGRRHGAFVLRGMVTEDDKHYCQICFENVISTAFFDCGHALACKQCAKAVSICPVCRKPVAARLELFGVKVSMQ